MEDVVMETGGRGGGEAPPAADRENNRQRRADGQGDPTERAESKPKSKPGKQKYQKFPKGKNPHAAPFRATGFMSEDPISLEELEARKRRAERFGLLHELQPALKKLKLINKPFPERLMFEGRIDADHDLPRRLDTVHMYGVDLMNSKDVLRYFSDYEPKYVEWINDSSCNIVFSNGGNAMRAIMGMGTPVRLDGVPTEATDKKAEKVAAEKQQADPSVGMYEWHRGPPFIKSKEGPAIHLMFRMATIEDRREANAPKQTRKLWRLPMSMATRIQKYDATEGGKPPPNQIDEQQNKGGGNAQSKKNLKKRQRRKAQKEAKLKARSQTGGGEAAEEGRVDDLRNLISRLRLTPPTQNGHEDEVGGPSNGSFTEGARGKAPGTPVNAN